MTYKITEYSKKKASELHVKIKPSENPAKKIDVYKNNVKIASIGSIKNLDYPTYILEKGKTYADERRRLYRIRHKKDLNNKNGNGYYANKILW
jgi:hypothetical protein